MKKIYVYYLDNILGTVYIDNVRNKDIYSFEYSDYALVNNLRYILLDDEILFTKGRQYKDKSNIPYHFLLDSMPDRWGRNLINRKYKGRIISDYQYLMSVSDISRMGALQYKYDIDGPYELDDKDIPPYDYINTLCDAAYNYDELIEDDYWKILLSPGSSLGGSRPKASIYDNDHNLYLAKFNHKQDEYNVSKVEYLSYRLATLVGINISPSRLIDIDNKKSVFLTRRFDRNKDKRIHYVSFMTLFNANEGESGNYTYLDVVEKLSQFSGNINNDLLELFKRIAFYIIIHNYDDHLRNIGMVYIDKRWVLSPCFDVNITLYKGDLSLGIDGINDNTLATLINNHSYFRLSIQEATKIVDDMKNVISNNIVSISKEINIPKEVVDRIMFIMSNNF